MKISKEQLRKVLQGLDLVREVIIEVVGDSEGTTNENTKETQTKQPATKVEADTNEDDKVESLIANLETLSFNEIKALCKEHGIPVKGSKATLITKLSGALSAEADEEDEEDVKAPVAQPDVDVEEDEDTTEENTEEPIEGNDLEDQLSELSVEELSDLLSEAGITPKGKKQALIAKILKAVEDGIIELDAEDETQDEEEEEEAEGGISAEDVEALLEELDVKTLKSVCKELDKKVTLKDKQPSLLEKIAECEVEDIINALIALDLIEDPEAGSEEEAEDDLTDTMYTPVGTPARQEKVTELFEQYKHEYEEGSVSDKEVKEFLKDYYNENPNDLNLKLPKEELALEYAWIHANLVDDDGEEVEFSEPYEVDGTYWSCAKPLKELDNGDLFCTVTGETYEQ